MPSDAERCRAMPSDAVKIADANADADKIADANADVDAKDANAEDVDADADTAPEQSDSAVGNCNIEEILKSYFQSTLQDGIEHSQLKVIMGKIQLLWPVHLRKIQTALFGRQIAANGWTHCFLMRHTSMVCVCI
jgi:hypothetical protein